MKYRHEAKIEIGYADLLMLRQRLTVVMQRDKPAVDGKYEIRSQYFDNAKDKALREKIDGVNMREKFRIRFYNGDTSYIKLEKKSKINGLCHKSSTFLTRRQAEAIARGDYTWMCDSSEALIRELYIKMKTQGLRPKVVVDYTREPFVYAPGNVRVTLDYNIRTGMSCMDFLEEDCVTIPIETESIILEVKWDEYLPDIIRDIVHVQSGHVAAFSKYAACRIYG